MLKSKFYAIILSAALLTSALALLSSSAWAQTSFSYSEADFDPELIRCAVAKLFELTQGAFGALLMTVAGIIAIISAAMGAYRMSLSIVFIGVGAFILPSLVSLFFGVDFELCDPLPPL